MTIHVKVGQTRDKVGQWFKMLPENLIYMQIFSTYCHNLLTFIRTFLPPPRTFPPLSNTAQGLQNLHTISVVQIDVIEKMEIYFRLMFVSIFIAPRVIYLNVLSIS